MSSPTLGTSVAMGIRAAAREGWLLPVAAVVGILRSAAILPALAVGVALPLEGAAHALRSRPLSFAAPFEGALAVATSVRFLALVGALALAGAALAGLLRVLFLAGALPTLGARLAGDPSPRLFATGVAWGLPRQLATWLLAAIAEIAAAGYLLAALVGVMQAGAGSLSLERRLALAVLGALALALGAAGMIVARILGDAAAARTAILGEGPGEAFAGAVRGFLDRPGTFAVAGLCFALAALAVGSILQPASAILGQVGERLEGALLLGPQLMLALIAALGGAAVDLGWLATVSALACSEGQESRPGAPPRPGA